VHAAFSPNGARILTASDDNTARMWDAATGARRAARHLKGSYGGGRPRRVQIFWRFLSSLPAGEI